MSEKEKRTLTDKQRIKHLLWLHMSFLIHRYLLANTCGRLDGFEKAKRHRELCAIYIASQTGWEVDEADGHDHFMAIHDHTAKLTDYLDEEIGFSIYDEEIYDYDEYSQKFFKRFVELADEKWCELV